MPIYRAPLRDMRFVLHDVLRSVALADLPGYEEATPDLLDHVLEEAARFAEGQLFPLNQTGDAEGCTWDDGVVRTPKGFREVYRDYAEAGWIGLAADPAHGGQGLPQVLHTAVDEMLCSANLSFSTYPGLSTAASNAIAQHAEPWLQALTLPRLVDGSWSGTMCLTEAQCGTDLGLIKTRAEPDGAGRYRLTGTKIFITAGEHDLTENIVHLVLARLPDAPAGTQGISLFLVPKFLFADDGSLGTRNSVTCGGVERKMGLHASSTCTMHFDEAIGWLVGTPHKGMRAMFTMMNAARLAVGVQGLGIAEVAYQNARAYARERLQGRALTGAADLDRAADPLIVHPDVRRMLLTMKAYTEGARALAFWVGLSLDRHVCHPDAGQRREAGDLVSLLTPVVKAVLTDLGSEVANLAVQVWGGHGYVRGNGLEQYVRDVRIAQIYEGANGIQALDLVGRKMAEDTGRLLRRFFHPVAEELEAAGREPALDVLAGPLAKAFGRLQQASLHIGSRGLADPNEAGAAATDYLRLFGLVAMGAMWLRMAKAAQAHLAAGTGDEAFFQAKLHTARFYMTKLLPQAQALALTIFAGAKPVMVMPEDGF